MNNKNAVYLLRNTNQYSIYIDIDEHDPRAEPEWLSEVAVDKMNAIQIDSPMRLFCFEKRPGSEFKTDCSEVLEPCLMIKAKLKPKITSQWLLQSTVLKIIIDSLQRQNILPV